MAQIYKMIDDESITNKGGMIRIALADAQKANESGHGIFWTVNSFRGARQIANLVSVDAWAIDMDHGTKDEMLATLKRGLIPTMVVETKRGYQAYWRALDAKPEHWNSIVLDRLVPFYGADANARDLARVLRVPGFLHLKNPKEPFLIRKVWECNACYCENDMALFYPDTSNAERTEFKRSMKKELGDTDDLWESIWRMDCLKALETLSGTDAVCGDVFTFRQTTRGKFNIFSNGKGTSCWIDTEGRIGSLDKGGPTPWMWINWYHKNHAVTREYMRKYFPELPWNNKK